jgi:hypothetical protein
MSAMRSLKRGIAKRYKDRCAVIRAAHKPEEYLKHRSHRKRLEREISNDVPHQVYLQMLAGMSSAE